MKTLIKYISLLLFSGLIIPFYYQPVTNSKKQMQVSAIQFNMESRGFLFICDIIKNSFPVLKNLKQL